VVTGVDRPAEPTGPAFVLHEHQRPSHHFDLRLEVDGVLRSWALPKGLPPTTADSRLAVAVADHELDHLTYEDSEKSIADIGWWELHDSNDHRILLTLHGRHTAVRYALIATPEGWLLRRTKQQPLPSGPEADALPPEAAGPRPPSTAPGGRPGQRG
jgi:hypothetical protein